MTDEKTEAKKESTYSDEEVEALLKRDLPHWHLEGGWIRRKFRTHSWKGTLMVINTVGHLAEAAWHHPDITASYAWVEVRLKNHNARGITDKDFELAKKIEEVVSWQPGKAGGALEGTPEKDQNKAINRGGALLSPNSDGFVNFTAQSFSPQTGLHYANVSRTRSVFYWSGEGFFGNTTSSLRASDPVTGKLVWEHKYLEPHTPLRTKTASVLTTAGGLLFSGDISGNFIAFDARTGKILWHDELPDSQSFGVPISYRLDGKQYVLVPAGSKLVTYVVQ